MNAPLRWTMALIGVGALGFVAGQYLNFGRRSPPELSASPVIASSDPSTVNLPQATPGTTRRIPSTIRDILKLPGDFSQTTALYVLAASSDQTDIEQLLEEAKTIGRQSEGPAAASILYERFAEIDPEAAVAHMMRDDASFDANWLYGVFHSWARTDLDGAVAGALKLDDRNRQMAGIAIVRSRDDLPDRERAKLGSRMELRVALRDPLSSDLRSPKAAERAWQDAAAIADRDSRLGELYRLTEDWARQDPQSAIRAIETLARRGERDQLIQVALNAWAARDSRAALEWIQARPPSLQRTQLLANAFTSLAIREPVAALEKVNQLPAAEKQQVLPQVLMNWAGVDPIAAAQWVEKQPDTPSSRELTSMIASAYAQRDPEDALRWAASLPSEQGQVLMSQVIQHVSQDDPERASVMVSKMDEGIHRNNAIGAVAQMWAQSDPRAALAWLSRQSDTDATPDIYGMIFGQWATYDADAAVSQLSFMLDADSRNGAARGILENAYLESRLLDEVFQRLEGGEARRAAASVIYYRLREEDPRRAERYRIEAEMPPDESIVVN